MYPDVTLFDQCWDEYWRVYDKRKIMSRKVSANHLWNMALEESIKMIDANKEKTPEEIISLLKDMISVPPYS